jgi:hypothetical protein
MSDFDFMDIGLVGALAEELSQDERRRLKRLLDGDADGECDCCCAEDDASCPPDYDP